jgi:hypothetical protein
MNLLHTAPLLSSIETPQLFIVGVALLTMFIVGNVQYVKYRNREMWHATARFALEKGQPVPPMPVQEPAPTPPVTSAARDMRAGLILMAFGGGIAVFLSKQGNPNTAYAGAIPGFIGVALFIHGLIYALTHKTPVVTDDRSKGA